MARAYNTKPPYVVAKKRKDHTVYYFQVPSHLRPEGWLAAVNLGRDDQESLSAIYSKAWSLKQRLDEERKAQKLNQQIHRFIKGTLPDIAEFYTKSQHYRSLKKPTQKGYDTNIKIILKWSASKGHPHVNKLEARHVYGFLAQFADRPRTQQYLRVTFGVLLNQAVLQGYINSNIVYSFDMPKVSKERKQWKLWEPDHIQAFVETADALGYPNAGTAVLLAFETGQRQTDIFALKDRINYKSGRLSFVQSKTGQEIDIPATDRLQRRLATKPKEQLLLTVHDRTKSPWDSFSFNKVFRKVCTAAGLEGFSFRKIRNSLTVHGTRANMTDDEFSSIFGWSRNTVKAMKDNHYSTADQEVADRAVIKLENIRNKS